MTVQQRLREGRLKVARHLEEFLIEYRTYHRDQTGNIVKQRDHNLDATRYALVSLRMGRVKAIVRKLDYSGMPVVYWCGKLQNNCLSCQSIKLFPVGLGKSIQTDSQSPQIGSGESFRVSRWNGLQKQEYLSCTILFTLLMLWIYTGVDNRFGSRLPAPKSDNAK